MKWNNVLLVSVLQNNWLALIEHSLISTFSTSCDEIAQLHSYSRGFRTTNFQYFSSFLRFYFRFIGNRLLQKNVSIGLLWPLFCLFCLVKHHRTDMQKCLAPNKCLEIESLFCWFLLDSHEFQCLNWECDFFTVFIFFF